MANGTNGKKSPIGSESSQLLLALDSLLGHLSEQGHVSYGEVIDFLEEKRQERESPQVPLSIFRDRDLGSLEALTKFLRDHHDMGYSEIANLLNRDARTIWSSYNRACEKNGTPHSIPEDAFWIPANIFSDRRLGPLEALSFHLREEHGYSYTKIGEMLNRDARTIWTACRRANDKVNGGAPQ